MKPEELKEKLVGVQIVMPTPFKENYELDKEGLRKLTRFLIDRGIKEGEGVLIPAGSTGECPMLDDDERKEVFKIVTEEANGEVPVVVGCNHTDTRTVIKLAKYAQEIGASGVMINPPYYFKPSHEVIMNHYSAVAKEIDIGIMIYNNWFVTQTDISVQTLEKLAQIPNIIAIKENSPALEKVEEVYYRLGDKINVISGNGDLHEPYLGYLGLPGFVSAFASFMPEKLLEIYRLTKKGEYNKARDAHRKLMPLWDFYKSDDVSKYDSAKFIIYLKEIMNYLGLPAGPVRLPLVSLTIEEREKAITVLKQLGLDKKRM